MHVATKYRLLMIVSLACLLQANAQQPGNEGQDWWFWPDYTLDGAARNLKRHHFVSADKNPETAKQVSLPYLFLGQYPTSRMSETLSAANVPKQAFTAEMWLLNHVNQPIGAAILMRKPQDLPGLSWLLGYYHNQLLFSTDPESLHDTTVGPLINYTLDKQWWRGRWLHAVGTYDGTHLRLYLNGALVEEKAIGVGLIMGDELEMASYMELEPFMQLGDLVKNIRLLNRAINQDEVEARFRMLCQMVESGRLLPDRFHFNAGPYLTHVTAESVQLTWETDRPARAIVRYGEVLPLADSVLLELQPGEVHDGKVVSHIRRVKLDKLKAGTPYFYEIEALDSGGDIIQSGIGTFATARVVSLPYAFAVIGDTEGRPHINNRIAKLAWGERPDFALHLGDITDGGEKENKFEWNYEYFTGMGQLLERLPFFTVPGNGEGDLYWYQRYHELSNPNAYYQFSYGNADFFMLNSNKPEGFAPGGEQYQWLEAALKASTARWKFVAHHHAVYSADENDYGDTWTGKSALGDTLIQQIIPLYEKYGVDVVFYGHLHTYQRTFALSGEQVTNHGVVYVQSGGAGGNLEDFAPSRAWYNAKTFRGHHYCTVHITGDRLNLKVYDVDGELKDYVDITKVDDN